MPTSANERRQRKTEARKEEILRSAARAFARKGYHATSMEEIADALHMTKGSLYYYFKDKEEILFACHDHSLDLVLENLERVQELDCPPEEKLRELITGHVEVMLEALQGSALAMEFTALKDELLAKIVDKRDRFEAGLRGFITQAIQQGTFAETDTKLAAFTILGAINWIPKWYRAGGRFDARTIGEYFANHFIAGLASSAGVPPAPRAETPALGSSAGVPPAPSTEDATLGSSAGVPPAPRAEAPTLASSAGVPPAPAPNGFANPNSTSSAHLGSTLESNAQEAGETPAPLRNGITPGGAGETPAPLRNGITPGGAGETPAPLRNGITPGGAGETPVPLRNGITPGGAGETPVPLRNGITPGGAGETPALLPAAAPSRLPVQQRRVGKDLERGRRYLPHWQVGGSTYHITWRTRERELPKQAREIALKAIAHQHANRMHVHIAVVMPDHVHLLIQPTETEQGGYHDIGTILHSIKSFSAKRINKLMGWDGPLWQPERYDRIMRNEIEFAEKWEYIRDNPAADGLAPDLEHWDAWFIGSDQTGRALPLGKEQRSSAGVSPAD